MSRGTVSKAARLIEVLRDEFGATVPSDISPAAVGDNIVSLIQHAVAAASEPGSEFEFTESGRIRVTPEWDEGRLVGFDIQVGL